MNVTVKQKEMLLNYLKRISSRISENRQKKRESIKIGKFKVFFTLYNVL